MGYNYAVIGAGRQGTAAAYDMAKRGNAEKVLIGDISIVNSEKAANRVNSILNKKIAKAKQIDVKDHSSLVDFLTGVDSFLSSVPYYYNLDIAKAAIEAKANMCDLGGNTDLVKEQLKLNTYAKEVGISIVPDCGQVPGMGTTLCVYAMSLLDKPREVFIWDGGLPQNPRPPFNYLLTFNIEGLTNEYAEPTIFLRDGKLIEIQPLEELETIDFTPPIGRLEAFTTGGGTSTAPWTFEGKLITYQNKTVRYPGHFAQLRAWYDLGLFDLNPLLIDDQEVIPRKILHTLLEPKVVVPGNKDLVVIRIKCLGKKDGKDAEVLLELIDYYDESTGFTAMERTTGWDASIVAIMMAQGKIQKGAIPVELAIPGDYFIEELAKRGIEITTRIM
ncbi:MAG: saccharopine dehydrogenase family protein [Promethearchaeota archaeon]